MNPKLAIVILNWNGKELLRQFLPSLLERIPEYAEVIVADNASGDGSVLMLAQEFPQLRVVVNAENGGFSRGYNLALKQIEAEYYCLLNSDVEVTEHWAEPIIEMMEQNEEVAVVQPKLRAFHEKDHFEYAGASGGFVDKYGYPFCRGRLFSKVEKDQGQYDSPMEIFWATGAALFVRSNIYNQLGGLDEDFFAHMEEIDFCWRVKNAGYKIMVNPKSVVYHVGGATLNKENPHKTLLNFRNNHFLLIKNLPAFRLFITIIVRFFLDNVAALVFLLKGSTGDFFAVYKAMVASTKSFGKMAKKRKNMPKSAYKDTCKKSIVCWHYLFGKNYFDGKKFHH